MKTEITVQQPLAGGQWAYMVTRDNRALAWGEAATKRQALDEAASACGVRPCCGNVWLIVFAFGAAAFALSLIKSLFKT